MRKFVSIVRALLVSALLPCGAAASAPAHPAFAEGRILVKPHAGLKEVGVHAALAAQGAEEIDRIRPLNVRIVRVPAHRIDRVLEALNRNPNIEFAEKDPLAQALLTPNDPYYSSQWHLPKISSPEAWQLGTGDSKTIIAVLDTGVSYSHPDLKGKVYQGYNFVSGNTNAADDNGHGTLVAGAAAALSNNGAGVSGVAWQSMILPVKVLDASGSGSHSAIANGITYAADQGARIINLSLGGTSGSLTLEQAVKYAWSKNAVILAAAGNNGNNTVVYPAGYQNVIGISALTSSDTLASWSTYGTHVSLAAPGENILTTTLSGSYGYASGTSLACPLVAGVAALTVSAKPELTNTEIRGILEKSATDVGAPGFDTQFGYGRVDAYASVKTAAGTVAPDTTPPAVAIGSPGSGAIVAGVVDVNVDASDNVGVTRVELLINNKLFASTTASSVAFVWNTAAYANGTHVLQARAYDAAGNTASSTQVSVTVINGAQSDAVAPQVAFHSPADGASVSKWVKINIGATDNVGVTRIEFYLNGQLFGTSNSPSASFSWNTNRAAKGEHRLQAYAFDAAGNVGTSSIRVYKR